MINSIIRLVFACFTPSLSILFSIFDSNNNRQSIHFWIKIAFNFAVNIFLTTSPPLNIIHAILFFLNEKFEVIPNIQQVFQSNTIYTSPSNTKFIQKTQSCVSIIQNIVSIFMTPISVFISFIGLLISLLSLLIALIFSSLNVYINWQNSNHQTQMTPHEKPSQQNENSEGRRQEAEGRRHPRLKTWD